MVAVARKDLGLTLDKATEVVGWFFDTIAEQVVGGGEVVIRGFGSFKPYHKPPKNWTNPKTGVPSRTEGGTTVVFRPGEPFVARLNTPST